MNKTRKILAILICIIVIMLIPQTVKAGVLQANPTTNASPTKLNASKWMPPVRNMETTGQAMGLTETINTDLTGGTANGIDVHMMKSTEYGALAILSASGFGNPANTTTINTSTGNATGVYMQSVYKEFVAGGGHYTTGMYRAGYKLRYYNIYTKEITSKNGDALNLKWHSATWNNPFNNGGLSEFAFTRGGNLGVFGLEGGNANTYTASPTRAVVVSADGI